MPGPNFQTIKVFVVLFLFLRDHFTFCKCTFPAKVESFLHNEQVQAATKIQKIWRGQIERNRLSGRRDLVQQTRAAIKIQRTVRMWLERLEKRKGDMPIHLRPSGLTDERRVELQKAISNFREENPVCQTFIMSHRLFD